MKSRWKTVSGAVALVMVGGLAAAGDHRAGDRGR